MTEAMNGVLRGGPSILAEAGTDSTPGTGILDLGKLSMLKQEVETRVAEDSLQDRIETLQDERGLVIRVMESAAFDPGSADLKPQIYPVLSVLSHELASLPNHVRVEGHTDNTPIATPRYPSNWELSTARSTGVVRYLVEQLKVDPRRVSALGYAEYRPIADNDTPAGRSRNRRVDIIVLNDETAEPEARPIPLDRHLARADSLLEGLR
jgi:chemotaxis protein MotB